MNKIQATTWVVLASLFAPYGSALAAPGLRESIKSDISSEFEKRYELETPGIGPTFSDKLLASSSKAIKENVIDMLTDFKMGVVRGADLAVNGNGTIVVIGAKQGWKLFKEYGEAAGIRYVDSIYLLPKKAVTIGKGFVRAGENIGRIAAHEAVDTAQAWQHTGRDIVKDAEEFKNGAGSINRLAGAAYETTFNTMANGIRGGGSDAVNWSQDVLSWTKDATQDAFVDLTQGTVNNAKATGRWTSRVGKFWVDETVNAATSVNSWTRAAANWTVNATGDTWNGTVAAGSTVFDKSMSAANTTGEWVVNNTTTPMHQAIDATKAYSKWNWKRGYTDGLKEGFHTAGNAWNHDDKLMATLWTMAGVGQAGLHILLLEPTVVPVLATYGIAGTVALSAVGYPSVGALYLGGIAATGVTYAGGTLATGAVATLGTAATIVAGGGGIVRTGATVALGTTVTAATAVGGAAITAGVAGANLVRTVGTPIIGGIGMAGTMAAGGAEIVGSAVLGTVKAAGITALTATGYSLLTAVEAAKMTYSAVRATGVTVFDNAIVTPIGVVTNLAQAIGTGAWTLSEDPVLGTLDVIAAGGIAVGTIATSTGAFSYELVKGIVKGLVHGVVAVGASGVWIVGAVAKGIEFIYASLNAPQHKAWANFRKEETADVFETLKKEAAPALADRFGDIILVRVHWWGDDKGRVRFFVSKDKKTGERWFFKRVVDSDTCEVMYKITNQDPVVRAFTHNPWGGIYQSGLTNKACAEAKQSN